MIKSHREIYLYANKSILKKRGDENERKTRGIFENLVSALHMRALYWSFIEKRDRTFFGFFSLSLTQTSSSSHLFLARSHSPPLFYSSFMASSETRMKKGREKEEAIANGVKVRSLQAGFMQKSSPSSTYSIRIPSSSSASRPLPNLSAHDYPVFTPVTSLSLSLSLSPYLFLIIFLVGFHVFLLHFFASLYLIAFDIMYGNLSLLAF